MQVHYIIDFNRPSIEYTSIQQILNLRELHKWNLPLGFMALLPRLLLAGETETLGNMDPLRLPPPSAATERNVDPLLPPSAPGTANPVNTELLRPIFHCPVARPVEFTVVSVPTCIDHHSYRRLSSTNCLPNIILGLSGERWSSGILF